MIDLWPPDPSHNCALQAFFSPQPALILMFIRFHVEFHSFSFGMFPASSCWFHLRWKKSQSREKSKDESFLCCFFSTRPTITFCDDMRQHYSQECIDLSYWVLQLAHIRERERFRNRHDDDSMQRHLLCLPSFYTTWLASKRQWDFGVTGSSELDISDTSPRARLFTY